MKNEDKVKYLDLISQKGVLTFASRLKRLTDLLFSQAQELYKYKKRDFKTGWFAFLLCLRQKDGCDLKSIAKQSGISTPTASQIMKELSNKKYIITSVNKKDFRYKTIKISPKGSAILEEIVPELKLIEDTMRSILGKDLDYILAKLSYLEQELKARPFKNRVLSKLEIKNYNDKYKSYFESLNEE